MKTQDAFDLYHQIQEAQEKQTSILGGPALPALGHAIAGSTGAAISNICTYPLALIITRLQIQRQLYRDTVSPHSEAYKSIQDAAHQIYAQEGGLNGFYVGVLPDTSKTIADSFLFFLGYNFLRQSRFKSSDTKKRHLPILDELTIGFLAGALSKFITTPIANIVTRKQTSSMLTARSARQSPDQDSVSSIAYEIYTAKGLQGFWSGYSASLVLTLNPSLTFFFFETVKRAFLPREQRSSPSGQATFLIAAVSKALASTITYPFSLAKSRLQASSTKHQETSGVKSNPRHHRPSPLSVFTVILDIAQTEGLAALYEGLEGEVLKGFFSHGITMIVKDAVHKLVIRANYIILRLLRKYPSPQQLAVSATEQGGQIANDIGEKSQQVINHTTSGMQTAAEKSHELVVEAKAKLTTGNGI